MKSISQFQFQKFIFTILLLLAFNSLIAQQKPSWQWAKGISGYSYVFTPIGVTASALGNSFVTGSFNNTITIDTVTISGCGHSIFIAKFDSSGNLAWARTAINDPNSSCQNNAFSVKTDIAENVYISGDFLGTISFGSDTLTSKGDRDIFIAKYDPNGVFQWAKSVGGLGKDDFTWDGMEVDKNSNVFITGGCGRIQSSPTVPIIGTTVFDTTSITGFGSSDIFIASYDKDGNLRWVKLIGSKASDVGITMGIDSSGSIYVGGSFGDTVYFDNFQLTGGGFFIAKYDNLGNAMWAKAIGGTVYVGPIMDADPHGNVYITGGSLGGIIDFGQFILNIPFKSFLAKYDTHGNLMWANPINIETPFLGISTDISGPVYLGGKFSNSYVSGSDTLKSNGGFDCLLLKYDTNGNEIWALQAGGGSSDVCDALYMSPSGNLYAAGFFVGAINFGNILLQGSTNVHNLFIAKLSQTTDLLNESFQTNSLQIFPNPTSGIVNIHCTDRSYSTAKLFDQLGREVLSQQLKEKQTSIHVDHLADGVYYLQLWDNNSSLTQKIVIQH